MRRWLSRRFVPYRNQPNAFIPSSITRRLLLGVSLGIAGGVYGLRIILNEHSEEALCCLALLLPLPPKYSDQRFFSSHRKDYEQLVGLARNHGLEHSTECWFSLQYEKPAKYAALSKDCTHVSYEPTFSVQFAPTRNINNIVYIEDSALIKGIDGCGYSDSLIEPLDDNWFYCTRKP